MTDSPSSIFMPMAPEAPPTTTVPFPSTFTRRCLALAAWLVLLSAQVLASLMVSAGEFIFSDRVLVTPFRICLSQEHGLRRCSLFQGSVFQVKIVLGLYMPVVLLLFALLAMLFAAYAKEKPLLWFSGVCQGVSSLLVLIGLTTFLWVNWPYVAWGHMTLWFYTCAAVQVQLVVTTYLTYRIGMMI